MKKGFTLAEVLITLGIIGIVAAMTMPSLMNAYKAYKFRSQFNKSYSVLKQIARKMQADDIPIDPSSFYQKSGTFAQAVKKYLNSAVDCGTFTKNSGICYQYNSSKYPYKSLSGRNIDAGYFDDGELSLPDGSLFLFEQPAAENRLWVWVDLNGGSTPPNKLGYDLFVFQVIDSDFLPMGAKGTDYEDKEQYCSFNSTAAWNGMGCTEKAVKEQNYFKNVLNNKL